MRVLESWLVVYLLNSLWQLPLVFLGAWIAARLVRPIGPRGEHRIWVGALFVETILPACQVDLAGLGRQAWMLIAAAWGSHAPGGSVQVIVAPQAVSDAGMLRLPPALAAAIVAIYACVLAYFAIRLAWGLWKTHLMLRESIPADFASCAAPPESLTGLLLNRHQPVDFVVSPFVSGPVTIGITRRVLLLPPGFLESVQPADLDAVLAHEFAHMRRFDFAKNLLYALFSLPVAYHPLLWLTSSRLAETREMICDELAADAVTGRERYARSLLRLASRLTEPMPVRTLHAIGIFDANIFERRIMNLAQKRIQMPTTRRLAIASAAVLLATAACGSALALRIPASAVSAQPEGSVQSEAPKKIHVKEGNLRIITKVQPVYPADAKAAGIQGTVILETIINKEGIPEEVTVKEGPDKLQQSARDAVRQWRWEPYLLNGEPIAVDTTITVIYSLEK